MSETGKTPRDSASIAETIFLGARDLSLPQERAAFLDQACGRDRALRERVEGMLNAERKADHFLANNPLELDAPAPGAVLENVGTMIGRYKLLQQLGEGGCGIVYMAEQDQPIRRRVALKVIKPGMDTRQVIARFEAERQALAMMDHPNIARVLDAGTTENGRPYFVMELVRGIRITEYCDQNNLPTRERLDLFTSVVQAVQHAHQKGIIHRDLKPSNVLVTLHDGVPVPKVIDFGIAKALEQKLTDKTLFTQFEQFIGTPAYTSPEQAEMSGLDIDTRSDIYSLGVLLYELLVGKTPFDAHDLVHSGLDEMRRIIREREPDRPSTRLSTMVQGEVVTTAQHRRVSAPELIHLLKGDLDWIVMKCLEKDRTRRYDTANGLSHDIQRYLSNEPVTARPPSRAYRLGKFVRRNKLAFAAGVAVTIALLSGIVVSTWQATRAWRAEQVAKEEKESAEAVLKFVRDKILAAGRPEGQEGGLGKDVTLRQAIDAAEAEIAKSFTNRPLVESSIRKTLGESYRYLGEPALAVRQLEQAYKLRREKMGGAHPTTRSALDALRDAYGVAGTSERSLPLYEEMLRLSESEWGREHSNTLDCIHAMAIAYSNSGKYDKSLELGEELVRRSKARLGLEDPGTLSSMNNLGVQYIRLGRHQQALDIFEEVLKIQKAKPTPDHAKLVLNLCNLATVCRNDKDYGRAIALFEEALALQKLKMGPGHPETLQTMSELALTYGNAGKLTQALEINEEALELRKIKLGPDHPDTIDSMFNLAQTHQMLKQFDQAAALYRETARLEKAKFGQDHARTLGSMSQLAGVASQMGRIEEAVLLDEQVLDLRKAKLGPDHRDTLESMSNLASGYRELGRLDEAEALYREYLKHKSDTLNARLQLASMLLDRAKTNRAVSGESAEVEQILRDYLAVARIRHTNDAAKLESALYDLAELYFRQHQYAEAEPLYREILQSRDTRLGAAHEEVIIATASLGRALADWAWAERDSGSEIRDAKSKIVKRAREAERLLRDCLAWHLKGTNTTHWRGGDVRSRLGGALVSVAVTDPELHAAARAVKLAEAEALLLEGQQQSQSKSALKKHKRDALERLVRLYEAWGKPDRLSEWQQQLAAFDKAKTETSAAAE
jgi:serine/threonine protein kinase/tetratricopeptide (TPR) repeat protein